MTQNHKDNGVTADRLTDLQERINNAQTSSAIGRGEPLRPNLPRGAMALASRVGIELVCGVVVGGFIGWVLDGWLGTEPWLMIILLFLGAGAGMMNIWREVSGYGLAFGYFDADTTTARSFNADTSASGGYLDADTTTARSFNADTSASGGYLDADTTTARSFNADTSASGKEKE